MSNKEKTTNKEMFEKEHREWTKRSRGKQPPLRNKPRDVADRTKEMKKSGIVQNYYSRFSNFLSSCTNNIKLNFLIWNIDRRFNRYIRIHCNNGFHKLNRQTWKMTMDKRSWGVEFLECPYCNHRFFTTVKDKQTFLKLTSNKNKIIQEMWKNVSK